MQRWGATCLVLLVLSTTAGAFLSESEVDQHLSWLTEGDDDEMTEASDSDPILGMTQEFDLALSGLADSPMKRGLANQADCRTCVRDGIKWVMGKACEVVSGICKNTTCPKIKEMCIRAKQHPKVVLGYMLYKVRPISHSFAYCFGAGSCDEKSAKEVNVAEVLVEALDLNKGHHGMFDFLSGTKDFLGTIDLQKFHTDMQTVPSDFTPIGHPRELSLGDNDFEESDFELSEGPEGSTPARHHHHHHHHHHHRRHNKHKFCKACVRLTVAHVMKHVAKEAIRYCAAHSKCPKVKAWCAVGENNPQVAIGVLFAAVRPFKFSAGFCIGKGFCCAHGHRHHHHNKHHFEESPRPGMNVFSQ